ncbi:hypothetical protein JXB02_05800 [Candidatus Woesearchaeota archaeon]|nr:hypothetical protein [Candidatus Woesearchaeota archaeon]
MRILTFATGNFFRQESYDINRILGMIRRLGPDIRGVELTLGFVEDALSLRLTKASRDYLSTLDFNTIHGPLFDRSYTTFRIVRNERTRQVLGALHRLYDRIDGRNINFHVSNIRNYAMLDDGYSYSIENIHESHGVTVEEAEGILDAHPRLGLVLDSGHSQNVGPAETRRFVERLAHRVRYVHLKGNEHGFQEIPTAFLSKEALREILTVKELDVPFCIETWLETEALAVFREEIAYAKGWLGIRGVRGARGVSRAGRARGRSR